MKGGKAKARRGAYEYRARVAAPVSPQRRRSSETRPGLVHLWAQQVPAQSKSPCPWDSQTPAHAAHDLGLSNYVSSQVGDRVREGGRKRCVTYNQQDWTKACIFRLKFSCSFHSTVLLSKQFPLKTVLKRKKEWSLCIILSFLLLFKWLTRSKNRCLQQSK